MVYDNEFSARWSDVDLIRKREQTCVALCTFRLGSLLVCTIKDTTSFTTEYLTRISNYSRTVKRTTKITRERLPRVIDYSRVLLGIFWQHCDSCVPRVLEDNSRVFFEICRGTKKNTCAIVNLAVGCAVLGKWNLTSPNVIFSS